MIALGVESRNCTDEGCAPSDSAPLFPGGIVTTFEGKTRDYIVDRYLITEGSRRYLTKIAIDIYLRTYPERDQELSIERMKHGLSHPRTILQLARYAGVPVGFGTLRGMTFITGSPGKRERIGYSSRAIVEEHGGEGIGTMFLDEGIKALDAPEKPLDAISLMTQNVLSVVTLRKSIVKLGFGETIYPFDQIYAGNRPLQDLLLAVHKEVRLSSDSIRTWNGLSEGELKELGMNEKYYRPDRSKVEAWGYYYKMVIEWGLNRERGDVLYVIAPRKKPTTSAEITMILPQTA